MLPQTDEKLAKNVQGDVVLLDQHQTELRRLDKEIDRIQAKLPSGGKKYSIYIHPIIITAT